MLKSVVAAILMATLLTPIRTAAQATTLRGHWEVRLKPSSKPGEVYQGAMLVDAEGRVTWDSPNDAGKKAKLLGYIASSNAGNSEFIMTDRTVVHRMHCSEQSTDFLSCRVSRSDGSTSREFWLARIAPGPARLVGN